MYDFSSTLSIYPLVIHLLDFFGTMAFAVTGSFKAIEQKSFTTKNSIRVTNKQENQLIIHHKYEYKPNKIS